MSKTSGSDIAKNGFRNEEDVAYKFNNWQDDTEARTWLTIMSYDLEKIETVKALVLKGHKADIQVQVFIKLKNVFDLQNVQVKLVSNKKGFNQIDKRRLSKYLELWNIPSNVYGLLEYYTGEKLPRDKNTKNKKRMFANEFTEIEQKNILDWIEKNKIMIVSDIIRGRGEFASEWILVAQKITQNSRWVLKHITDCINYYGSGEILISSRGTFKIGKITMQRKGGDGGADTAKMLQFKIDPTELFNIME